MNEQGEKLPRATICVVLMLMTFAVSDADVIRQPPELRSGDRYRLVFLTSTKRDALSSDIADYDAFVQAAVDASPEISKWGLAWNAIGSTAEVDARDHVNAHPGVDESAAVYRIDGSLFSVNYGQFWNGDFNVDPSNAIRVNEFGEWVMWGDEGTIPVWTGTFSGGIGDGNELGSSQPVIGRAEQVAQNWLSSSSDHALLELPIYAISEVLVAVPEPNCGTCVVLVLFVASQSRRERRRRRVD